MASIDYPKITETCRFWQLSNMAAPAADAPAGGGREELDGMVRALHEQLRTTDFLELNPPRGQSIFELAETAEARSAAAAVEVEAEAEPQGELGGLLRTLHAQLAATDPAALAPPGTSPPALPAARGPTAADEAPDDGGGLDVLAADLAEMVAARDALGAAPAPAPPQT